MGLFNFNIPDKATRTSAPTLKPLTIHKVKFQGVEPKEITSVKDGVESKYKLLEIKFENESGKIALSIFYPNERDAEPIERTGTDGHKYHDPSNWDQTKAVISQTLSVINPKGFEKFKEVSKKFRSFEDMAAVFIKLLEPNKGDEVYIKFDGYINKKGYLTTTFPRLVRYNKEETELWYCDNYIAKEESGLALSSYEINRRTKLEGNKPTTMEKDPLQDSDAEEPKSANANKAALDIDALLQD